MLIRLNLIGLGNFNFNDFFLFICKILNYFLFNFRINRPDFPAFYKDAIKADRQNQMKKHEMKKQRFTAYDDVPSEPDDDV